jgi:hypothetical protein
MEILIVELDRLAIPGWDRFELVSYTMYIIVFMCPYACP